VSGVGSKFIMMQDPKLLWVLTGAGPNRVLGLAGTRPKIVGPFAYRMVIHQVNPISSNFKLVEKWVILFSNRIASSDALEENSIIE